MPTAMKNRPSSGPLKGSMSVSSSRRYSLSASSTARKAPSAMDMPTSCISAAMATTSSSAAAVQDLHRAAAGRSSAAAGAGSRPPSTMPAITPTIFAASASRLAVLRIRRRPAHGQQRQQGEDGDGGHVLEQQDGEAGLPLLVGSRCRSPSTQRDRGGRCARPRPRDQGHAPGGAGQQAGSEQQRRASQHLHAAPAEIGRRRLHRRRGSSSRPTRTTSAPRRIPRSAGCPRR